MPRVGDQDEDAATTEIALLRSDPTLDRLNVIDPSLRLHQYVDSGSVDDGIRTSSVSGDGNRDLRPPSQARRDSASKSFEQGDMGDVANWISVGVEPGSSWFGPPRAQRTNLGDRKGGACGLGG